MTASSASSAASASSTAPSAPLAPGTSAPDFALTHRVGEAEVRLSEAVQKGPVVVLFFPLAFSPTCTEEICAVAEDWSAWDALGAQVLGISVDSPFVNARFADVCNAPFPILSDFNREAVTAWGVRNDDFFGMRGVADRAAFVVDTQGTIRWAWSSDDASVLPDFAAIKRAVEAL